MCGIAGIVDDYGSGSVDQDRLLAMGRLLRHRGPDDEGTYVGPNAGLVSCRLAVVDVAGGRQPARGETGTVHAVVNGEIYNFRDLRRLLMRRGHHFAGRGDAEVVPHLYEEYGPAFVE